MGPPPCMLYRNTLRGLCIDGERRGSKHKQKQDQGSTKTQQINPAATRSRVSRWGNDENSNAGRNKRKDKDKDNIIPKHNTPTQLRPEVEWAAVVGR